MLLPNDFLTVAGYRMDMQQYPRRYISYLLRLWQADSNGKTVCRYSLENPHTGNLVGFANFDDLIHFLADETTRIVANGEEVQKEM
ncbi:MAG TPA: hypothetical protein DEH25_01275 [Chloroflexi bacterium]|nr:hypothetical protein [Chloroflexota bacterium]HBY08652.1 hypothetical protein [Chloroflexota bacterium]